MIKNISKTKLFLYVITLLTAVVIFIDFALPGNMFIEENVNVSTEREDYYNAGGNSHNTYKVITTKHQFSVSEDFAKLVDNKKIKYFESLIFKEINRYELVSSGKGEIYSFRIISGLVLPIIMILALLVAYKYEHKINILIFVLQIVLLGNLIILIL